MCDSDCVRVALRIRPLVKTEIDKGCQDVVDRVKGEPQVIIKNHDSYTFNYVFTKNEPQKNVYEESVQSIIENLFKGYNVTILAYGQTGSGKTHTMGTSFSGEKNSDMGVIPRAMHDIFNKINEMSESHQISVSCSFMELYQETLYDLLSNAPREQSAVDIREDANKEIVIPGLTEMIVSSAEQTTNCLIKGSAGRAVGATAMNEQSSRSHAIFTININIMKNNDISSTTTSKFNLVDLAGSERSKKTKATGDRFKEGVNINKGLLALGNVISALGSGQNSYVSYRDSKLTRLLQDSLGGNSITLMIACISPADYNLDETISTLRYADRARKIKNKPVVNQDPQRAEINRLNNLIQNLRLQLLGQKNYSLSNIDNTEINGDISEEIVILKKQNFQLAEKNQQLRHQLQATLHDVTELELRATTAEDTHDKLFIKFNDIKKILVKNNNENEGNEEMNKKNYVCDVQSVVYEMDKIFHENREALMNQKSQNNNVNDETFLVQFEEVQQKFDQFTTKQFEINSEIRKINRELALKESHHQKVSTNLTKFCDYHENVENLKDSEIKIKILEAEKSDLLDKLKSVKENVSAKIAEERRKRLQQLEHEIADMRKKILQQDKLLKVREKETQKIINLNKEIEQMKAMKVNLIKTMKKESESFRQWKFNREKELTQLKAKDRKLQNEMVRMEALHNKQKNVLKRKVEEAVAVNKRLKDILEKQKQVQIKRNASNQTQSGKTDQIITLIDHELELILSVVDAQVTLDQLMEDRASINQRLKELKSEKPINEKEIKATENDLSMRNAQIDDIQQKIMSSDIMSKIREISKNISNSKEIQDAIKHLFNTLIELRREHAFKNNKIEEYKSAYEMSEERSTELKKLVEENEFKYKQDLLNIEKNYEEKISVLLRELSKLPNDLEDNNDPETSERVKIQQEALDKIDILREELDNFKAKCCQYEKLLQNPSNKKSKKKVESEVTEDTKNINEYSDTSFENDADFDGSSCTDPDWEATPKFRKPKKNLNLRRTVVNQEITDEVTGTKRNSDGVVKCRCKLDCRTKRCSCRSNGSGCSDRCSCNTELCKNKDVLENGADSTSVSSTVSDSTFVKEKENIDSNKDSNNSKTVLNTSTDIFDHSSYKDSLNTPKKFKSMEEEENKLDVTTPKYPFNSKKRPLFYQ